MKGKMKSGGGYVNRKLRLAAEANTAAGTMQLSDPRVNEP